MKLRLESRLPFTSATLRFAGQRGEMMVFSGAHLHGTVPNRSDLMRFSIDFRIFHAGDLRDKRAAKNLDGACRNIEFGFNDLFRASDFKPFPEIQG